MTDLESRLYGATSPDSTDFQNRFFCKLFDDMIITSLCLQRRRELNDRDRFTCRGCSKDMMIGRVHVLRKKANS